MNAVHASSVMDCRPAAGAGPWAASAPAGVAQDRRAAHAAAPASAGHGGVAAYPAQRGAASGGAVYLASGWLAPAAMALCVLHASGAAAQEAAQPVQGRYAMALPPHPASAASAPQGGAGGQAITPLRARTLFRLYCSGCHQTDGSGSPAFGVPSMRGTLGYFQRTPAGRAFLVQAPGARNAHVTDAELAALTNWALHEFSAPTLPADFKPYTTEEVARWRANPPLDVAGTRAAIAAGFPK